MPEPAAVVPTAAPVLARSVPLLRELRELNLEPASPTEAREMLGLPAR